MPSRSQSEFVRTMDDGQCLDSVKNQCGFGFTPSRCSCLQFLGSMNTLLRLGPSRALLYVHMLRNLVDEEGSTLVAFVLSNRVPAICVNSVIVLTCVLLTSILSPLF